MSGPGNPFHCKRTANFRMSPYILMNRSRPPVHEATGGHAVRTFRD